MLLQGDVQGLHAASGKRAGAACRFRKECGACMPLQGGVQPLNTAQCLHAYNGSPYGWLGVQLCQTGVLGMHTFPKGVKALHALQTGVHAQNSCPFEGLT